MTLSILSWAAVVILSCGYWFQVWKIHVHKEVRDLSLIYFILLSIGFAILGVTAFFEGTLIFMVKQIATFIPAVITCLQIIYHRKDTWVDVHQSSCPGCQNGVEPQWRFCANCGVPNPEHI